VTGKNKHTGNRTGIGEVARGDPKVEGNAMGKTRASIERRSGIRLKKELRWYKGRRKKRSSI